MELITGQFQSQGEKISQRWIHLHEFPKFFVAGKKTEPTSLVQLKILKFLNSFSRLPNSFFQLVFYPFLWATPAMLPVFLRSFTNALMWRAQERINGGSEMDFIVELL